MFAVGVRRDKAALSSGCEPHPATAPAASNRSSHEGNLVHGRCHVWTAPRWQGLSSRFAALVGAAKMRFTRPLAIMPSADQVPTKTSHSTMLWHEWVVLIAGSTGSALRAVRPPNLHITPRCPARSRLPRKRDRFLVSLAPGHHGPDHSRDFVGERDSRNQIGRASCRERV